MKFSSDSAPVSSITRLYLIRHGQTDWNLEGRYQGHADTPLNENGLAQARALAVELAGAEPLFSAVYTSDLIRARQTGEIIASTLRLPLSTDPRLREVDQGEWEGMLFRELTTRFADLIAERKADPLSARPPGGESLGELAGRARDAAEEIALKHPGEAVIIVSHGLTLAALIALARDYPLESAYGLIPPNVTPEIIEWDGGAR